MTTRTENRADGKLTAIAGGSRNGKTAWLKKQINKAKRLVVWDTRGEYLDMANTQRIGTLAELARALADSWNTGARLVYWGNLADFTGFCELVYAWGQLWPAVIVVEEISDVTHPGKAPPGWGELIRKGLYYGNHIYSVTQRPQECDKTVWGNASVLHTHGFINPADCAYMAERLSVSPDLVAALKPLEYIERAAGDPAHKTGKVRF